MKKAPTIQEKREKQTRNLKNINTEHTTTSTLDEHAPISRRRCINKQHKSWFDGKALKLMINRRKCEKTWHRSKCELHKRQYLLADKYYRRYLYQSKKKILRDKLSSDKNKTKTLYKITKILTSDTSENKFPESTSNKELTDTFADFL